MNIQIQYVQNNTIGIIRGYNGNLVLCNDAMAAKAAMKNGGNNVHLAK